MRRFAGHLAAAIAEDTWRLVGNGCKATAAAVVAMVAASAVSRALLSPPAHLAARSEYLP